MSKPPFALVVNKAPVANDVTDYDLKHFSVYLRLLDADAEGTDWAEAARTLLHIDPSDEPERARCAWESHLARAKWLMERDYRNLAQRRSTRPRPA